MEYSWSVLPAKENLIKSFFGLSIISAISATVYLVFESLPWAVFSAIVLVLALQRYFFTSFFKINDDGVNADYLIGKKHLSWKRIKTIKFGETSAFLSPMTSISRWTLNRGMFIVYNSADKDNIAELINKAMEIYGTD